jgi:glucose/mannose-6-phosphate isomerase
VNRRAPLLRKLCNHPIAQLHTQLRAASIISHKIYKFTLLEPHNGFLLEKLDSERHVVSVDRGGILKALRSYPKQIEDTLVSNREVRVPFRGKRIEDVVVCGVGGSGIAGDVIRDWLTYESNHRVHVCRSTGLPKFVDSRTLVICVSYSGNTIETLSLFREARRRKCRIASVASGGELARISQTHRVPVFKVEPGRQPRAALPSLVAAACQALDRSGIRVGASAALGRCARMLEAFLERIDVKVASEHNEAKQVAAQLVDRWVQVLALERDQCLARRFVAELNENSKLAANYGLIPEFSHNMIEAWPYHGEPAKLPLTLFSFRDPAESELESKLFTEAVLLVAERANAVALEYKPRSRSRLEMLMESIAFGDWVSYYLAILRGVDPSEIPAIKELKRRIQ